MIARSNKPTIEAVKRLELQLGSGKILSSGPKYEDARRVWNRAVDRFPAAIVRCESADDVQAAVRAAVEGGLSLSVRGGGHDWAGRAVDGELIIDLSPLCTVSVEGDEAIIGGGATSLQVAEAAGQAGLAPVTGNLGAVGITGLTLGGGYGPLTGRCGLASDNLVGAEVVTADGEIVWTDDTQNPDLIWALRGGGGNFGVVTTIRLRLHRVAELSAGMVSFGWDEVASVAEALSPFQLDAPDELTLTAAFSPGPDGNLALTMLYAWCGDPARDDDTLRTVTALGKAATTQVSRTSYVQMLRDAEAFVVPGISTLYRTVTLASLDPRAIAAIKAAMEERSSPLSYVVLHPFHGAGERIALEATAFGLRRKHFVVGIYAFWQSGADDLHRAWADALEKALTPLALPTAYPNYFGPDRPDQAVGAYGPNAARLLQVKGRYDPTGLFSAIALPPPSALSEQPAP